MTDILVIVTGGIAAYKAADLVSKLKKTGKYDIIVSMTPNACEFISPLVFETLSGNPVYTESEKHKFTGPAHINISKWADVCITVPATANFISKYVSGIADNYALSTIIALDNKKPVLFAPSMNTNMWQNPYFQENLNKLRKRCTVIEPDSGFLACGDFGKGRMAEPVQLLQEINRAASTPVLKGIRIGITAGATSESIDPIRFISNRSSGKMGYELAEAAYELHGLTTLISGQTCLKKPITDRFLSFESNSDLLKILDKEIENLDILIMSAAVSDYRPKFYSESKLKKNGNDIKIDLERTADLLKNLDESGKTKEKFIVGFALETEDITKNALKKLEEKNMDLIIYNSAVPENTGMGKDYISFGIITRDKKIIDYSEKMKKSEAARIILNKVVQEFNEKRKS